MWDRLGRLAHRLAVGVSQATDGLNRLAGTRVAWARALWETSGVLGRLNTRLLRRRYFEDALAMLLPEIDDRRRRATAAFLAAAHQRQKLLHEWTAAHGPASAGAMCREGGTAVLFDRLRNGEPTVLVNWHIGVWFGVASALARAGVPLISLSGEPIFHRNKPGAGKVEFFSLLGPAHLRASASRGCLKRLRAGGIVGIAADGPMADDPLHLPHLGRLHRVGRGAAALARITGAAMLPIAALWDDRGTRWRLEIGERLDTPELRRLPAAEFERETLSAASRHFETIIRRDPRQLRTEYIDRLLNFPLYDEGAALIAELAQS